MTLDLEETATMVAFMRENGVRELESNKDGFRILLTDKPTIITKEVLLEPTDESLKRLLKQRQERLAEEEAAQDDAHMIFETGIEIEAIEQLEVKS